MLVLCGDVIRCICAYLTFDEICMLRRVDKHFHRVISGNFFYDRKTSYLRDTLRIMPSQIMGFTQDINYRRYLKRKSCRAICADYMIPLNYRLPVKLTRYILKTIPNKIRNYHSYEDLVETRDREIIEMAIDLYIASNPLIEPRRSIQHFFRNVLETHDDELIKWFEEKYIGDELETTIREVVTGLSIWKSDIANKEYVISRYPNMVF